MPDIGDKEETVNAEQDLALKDDQVSTKKISQNKRQLLAKKLISQRTFLKLSLLMRLI